MKSNNPVLRFHEFNENWVLKSIEELAKEFFGGGTPKTTISEFWNGEIPWIQSSDLTNHKVYGVTSKKHINSFAIKNSATKIIPKDSIAIVTRVGVGKIALLEHPYSTSQDFLSLSELNINKWFGVYLLYNKLQKELKQVQGTSIKGITKAELLKKNVSIPGINEQSKIGDFFKTLDDTISLHRQELDALKQTKQGFLQKMFPRKGEMVPEIRFKDFVGFWEIVRLGNISNIVAGGDINKDKINKNGKFPVIANALTNEGIVGFYEDYYRIEGPAVSVTGRGDVGHAKARKYNFTPVVRLLSVKSDYDVKFLENVINNHKVMVESTGVPQLTAPQLSKYQIYIPSKKEAKKIGEFFSRLDEVIELKEQELEALKQTKKAFLQTMFI